MEKIFGNIKQHYRIRFYPKQKEKFRKFIIDEFNKLGYENIQIDKSKNIIIGDLENSKEVFSAHYDTPPLSFYITPFTALFGHWVGQLVSMLAMIIVIGIITLGFQVLKVHPLLSLYGALLVFMLLFLFPNPHNANDNTSGILAVYELAKGLSGFSGVAFILFNNEEWGLFGSDGLVKRYKLKYQKAPSFSLYNFDCVGLGIELILSYKGETFKQKCLQYRNRIGGQFAKIRVFKGTLLVGSDYLKFPNSVMITATNRGLLGGFYLPAIHMPNDKKVDFRVIRKTINVVLEIREHKVCC